MAAEEGARVASGAAAAAAESEEEEAEYVFVSLEGVDHADADLLRARELVVEGLGTENPKVTLAGVRYGTNAQATRRP